MDQYIRLINRVLKRYSAILKKTNKVLQELEGRGPRISEAMATQTDQARQMLNEAQFNSDNVGTAITNTQKALSLIHETLTSIAREYGGF